MTATDLTVTQDQVEEYIGIVRNTDMITAVKSIATLFIGFLAVRLVMRMVMRGLRKSPIPASLHTIIRTLLRIVLDLLVILTAASIIGIPVTSFVTVIGLAGLAVSLAMQGVVENFAGSIIILGTHPFEVGDAVEVDTVTGVVKEIRIMSTRLESFDGKAIYIPNSKLYTARIINYSQTGKRRVELSVSASYDNPPEQVKAAILSAISGTENVLEDPAPAVMVAGYGANDIQYNIWIWTETAHFLEVKNAVTEKLYGAFARHGVQMTYPHLNVHLDRAAQEKQ